MKRTYRAYTDEKLIELCQTVTSMAELLRVLNLRVAGGNYAHMKRQLQRLGLKCEHWKGQGWSRGEQLKDWSKYTRTVHCKKHLVKLRGNKCENCLLETWQNVKIPLEVHHRNGDRTNNNLENLQILCCNCHALTNNWRGKNIRPRGEIGRRSGLERL